MRNFPFILMVFIPALSFGQDFKIRIGGAAGTELDISSIPADLKFNNEIKTIEIKKITADNPAKKMTLNSGDESQEFSTDGAYHSLNFSNDIRETNLTVNDAQAGVIGGPFTLHKTPGGANTSNNTAITDQVSIKLPRDKTATEYLVNTLFKDQIVDIDGVGLKIFKTSGNNKETSRYMGSKYIHLFFDQSGNSLIHSIPVGVGRANYVVHIIYLVPKNNPLNIEYKASQNSADIEEGVVIRSEGGLQNALRLQALDTKKKVVEMEWRSSEILFTPSSYDVKFDIVRNAFQENEGYLEATDPVVVASKVIKIKKVYHGSIDVGVLKTNLENPSFTLTVSDIDPTQMVVKKTNGGSRILASAMYTFYLSPVVLIEKLFMPSKVQNYKIEGRSFVDDHKIYERIYPTAGIRLNDRLLEDVFLGGKWEFIRGGSLFIGYHSGRINVLNVDKSFEFEKTYITQSSFDLKTNTKRKGDFCIGLNLDVRIITNLFQTGTTSPGQ